MVFKKKKSKEELKQEETASVADKETKPEVNEQKGKLLVEMTEPERFVYLYQELIRTNELLTELIQIAKEE